MSFDHVWRVRKYLPLRRGQRCRVLVLGARMNTALVEFEDGYRVVTIRHFVDREQVDAVPGLFDFGATQ